MKKRWIRTLSFLVVLTAVLAQNAFAFSANKSVTLTQMKDIPKNWAEADIGWCVKTGLMSSTNAIEEGNRNQKLYFSPNMTLSRGQFVKILYTLASELGRDVSYTGTVAFPDVISGAWYYTGVQWGCSVGLVKGMPNGNFGTNDPVTREQLAVFMYRFLTDYCGLDLDEEIAGANAFADGASISGYALDSVKAMSAIGLMNGKGGNCFDPRASATRAEAAALVHRLTDYYTSQPVCFTGVALTKMWGDEFNGDTLDMETWEYNSCGRQDVYGFDPSDAEEVDQYLKDHIYLEDGSMVQVVDYVDNSVLKDDSPDFIQNERNTSRVWIETKERFEQPYGYYEMRCKFNEGTGVNSAFWMSAGDAWNGGSQGSKDGTEIDVFESMKTGAYAGGFTEFIQSTVHWQHNVPDQGGNTFGYFVNQKNLTRSEQYFPIDLFDGGYHTMGVLWTKEEYIFYYDGYEVFRTDCSESNGVCDVPAYLLISCHFMNPDWYGLSDPDDFPTDFRVDYVRWYQISDYLSNAE